jgi:hypothetical protein
METVGPMKRSRNSSGTPPEETARLTKMARRESASPSRANPLAVLGSAPASPGVGSSGMAPLKGSPSDGAKGPASTGHRPLDSFDESQIKLLQRVVRGRDARSKVRVMSLGKGTCA